MLNKRFYKYYFLRVARQKGTPENLGLSAAVGIFIGFFIPLGGQMILAFFLALWFGLNKFLAMAGVWVTNPVTIIPIYLFYFNLGSIITGVEVSKYLDIIKNNKLTWNLAFQIGKEGLILFFIGALITAIISSIITYFSVVLLVKKYRMIKK